MTSMKTQKNRSFVISGRTGSLNVSFLVTNRNTYQRSDVLQTQRCEFDDQQFSLAAQTQTEVRPHRNQFQHFFFLTLSSIQSLFIRGEHEADIIIIMVRINWSSWCKCFLFPSADHHLSSMTASEQMIVLGRRMKKFWPVKPADGFNMWLSTSAG